MTLGEIIKKYRTENKVSMEYVAKQCGITKGYVAMLEKNVNSKTGRPVKPTVETIAKVSKIREQLIVTGIYDNIYNTNIKEDYYE